MDAGNSASEAPASTQFVIAGTTPRESAFGFVWGGGLGSLIVWAGGFPAWGYLAALALGLFGLWGITEPERRWVVEGDALTATRGRESDTRHLSRIDDLELITDSRTRTLWVKQRYERVMELPLDDGARPLLRAVYQGLRAGVRDQVSPEVLPWLGIGTAEQIVQAERARTGYAGWIDSIAGHEVSMLRVFLVWLIPVTPVLVLAGLTHNLDRGPLTLMLAPVAAAYWFGAVPWWYRRQRRQTSR